MSKETFTKTFLCFSLGRTSPAALSLRSTAPWCSEIFGRGLGLMIRITRYGCLQNQRSSGVEWGQEATGVAEKKSVHCSCAVSSCHASFQPRQSFVCWQVLGGVSALEVLLMMPHRLRLLYPGERTVGGRGAYGSGFILFWQSQSSLKKPSPSWFDLKERIIARGRWVFLKQIRHIRKGRLHG